MAHEQSANWLFELFLVSLFKCTCTPFCSWIVISGGDYVALCSNFICAISRLLATPFNLVLTLIFGSSRYSYLLDWRQENSSVERLGIIRYICYLARLIWKPRRPASFFAYFRPDIPGILRLICCHTHLTQAVIQDLEERDITYADSSSMQDMIPGEDKAFVFVSGGICRFDDEDVNDVYLR